MSDCEPIRPLLARYGEGEVSPDEAMRVARHLADCTVCRIILARERRLAQMLAEGLQDVPVGEEFVRSVMATLPQGPPPGRRRRGLKLASLLVIGLLALSVGSGASSLVPHWPAASLPHLDLETAGSAIPALAGAARLVQTALAAVAATGVRSPDMLGLGLLVAALAGVLTFGAVSAASAVVACAAVRCDRRVD